MKVRIDENPKNYTTTVYAEGKKVIHKTVYNSTGMKILEQSLYCFCPSCKHIAYCSYGKTWKAKQLGRCDDFETE